MARRTSCAAKGSIKEHNRIVRETLILLGREAHQFCRVWDNPTGVAWREVNGVRTYIAYGLKGSSDIMGFMFDGRILCIEVKSGNATQQPNQMAFEAIVKKFGGHYIVVRSPEQALEYVLRVASR